MIFNLIIIIIILMVDHVAKRVLVDSKSDLRSLMRVKRNAFIENYTNNITQHLKWFTTHIDNIIA
jgi:hypothetical protein